MDQLELADRFDRERPRLRSVAYRIVGSLSEADDAVQETWLRLERADADEIENLQGWLTTVVARICLNLLRQRRAQREEPLDAFVPEPMISTSAGGVCGANSVTFGVSPLCTFIMIWTSLTPFHMRTPAWCRRTSRRTSTRN